MIIHRVAAMAALALACGCPAAAQTAEKTTGQSIVSEIKLGVLQHDLDFLGDNLEPGQDINGELLFASPGFLEPVFAPRPHIGVSVNTEARPASFTPA